MSKIIRKSNFDHEDHRGDQYFVAQRLSIRFYLVVDDNYLLPPNWEP
jgi:hypothetical protein